MPKPDPPVEHFGFQIFSQEPLNDEAFPGRRSAAVRNDDHGRITVDRPGPAALRLFELAEKVAVARQLF